MYHQHSQCPTRENSSPPSTPTSPAISPTPPAPSPPPPSAPKSPSKPNPTAHPSPKPTAPSSEPCATPSSAATPTHGLIGEEFGNDRPDAEWTWAIDPIDGTGAFASGLPTFATLIALLHHGSPVLGLIDQPILQERWLGAVFDGTPPLAEFASPAGTQQIHTSSTPDLENAIGFATTPAMFHGGARTAWQRLSASLDRVRYGVDAYAYGLLALGRIDLVCEASLKPWDYLALDPVIRAAGGVITDWQGRPLTANSGDQVLAAATRPLHRAALELLSNPAPAP